MPVKDPSPELLEAIRQNGVHGKVRAQWGYHRKASPRIFLLEGDEQLPEGWQETPHPDNLPNGDAG